MHGWKGLTWDLLMTWLASSWMENFTPSSEEKEPMGDRVPEVNTMVFTEPLKSEKACGTWKKHVLRRGFLLLFYNKIVWHTYSVEPTVWSNRLTV